MYAFEWAVLSEYNDDTYREVSGYIVVQWKSRISLNNETHWLHWANEVEKGGAANSIAAIVGLFGVNCSRYLISDNDNDARLAIESIKTVN